MPTTYGNDIVYCLKSHCGVRGYCRQKWVLQVQIICKFSNERTCERNKDVQGLSCGFEVYYKVTKGSSLDQLLLALILLVFTWLDEKLDVSCHTSFNDQLPYGHGHIFRKEQLPPCHWHAINNSIYKRPKTF